MRGFLTFLIGLVLIVVAAAIVVPMLIPAETVKAEVEKAVEDATGRKLTIAGDVSLSVLPAIKANIGEVTFANMDGAKAPNMAQMKEMEAQLELLPLLSGEVRVARFILVEPVINLEINKAGKANWAFEQGTISEPAPSGDAGTAETGGGETGGGSGGVAPREIVLADIRIENGQVSYTNAQTGDAYALEDVDVSLSLPGLDAPLGVDGGVTWNGERVTLDGRLERASALMARETTAASLSVSSAPVTFSYDGRITLGDVLATEGSVDLKVPSVRELAAWAGSPMAEGGGFGPLAVSGQLASAGTRYTFSNAKVEIDGMTGTGDIAVETGGARPAISGKLALDKLDVNAYGGEGDASWSTEEIDFSGLSSVDADLDLSVGEIIAGSIVTGEGVLGLKLNNGLLNATLSRLALYSGTGTGTLSLNGRSSTPSLKSDFKLTGLQIEPFLGDAMGFERLRGTGAINLNVTASGNSQAAMVKTLNGNGAIDFRDGAIKGINLAQTIRTALTDPISGWSKASTQDTDFSELSGTFTITNGVLSNNDLTMLGPLIRLSGAGSTSIPNQTIDYRLQPKLVASLEGQGGSGDVAGLDVPVKVSGTWANPKFAPDLEALVKDPSATLKNLENVKKLQGKDIIRSLTGGGTGDESGDTSSSEEKPKTIDKMQPKDLLKGFLGK